MKSKNSKLKLASLALMSAPLLFTSCFEESDEILNGNGLIPGVISFEPQSGDPGDSITIIGKDLEDTNNVLFNGANAEIVSTSENTVVVLVPETASTGPIRIETVNGLNEFRENFRRKGAPFVTNIEPALVQAGQKVTLTGEDMNETTTMNIGGVEVTNLQVSSKEVTFTVAEGTPLGTTAVNITSRFGENSTDIEKTPLLIAGTVTSLVETFDNNENLLSHGSDAEVSFNGLNSFIAEEAPFIPEAPIDGAFYYIGGTSDTSDSGSFTGLIGSSEQSRDTYASFFNDNPSASEIYFNIDINFGEVPAGGEDDDLAGIRLRFDEGYDLDNDGSSSDEFMEYRPTINDLAEKGFIPNENGWYSISIRLDEFLNSGPSGGAGTWDKYNVNDLTRIAIASRREYNGLYSMSIDNVSISVGIPVNERTTTEDNK